MRRTLALLCAANGFGMAAFCAFLVWTLLRWGVPLSFGSVGATLGSAAGLMVITAVQLPIPRSGLRGRRQNEQLVCGLGCADYEITDTMPLRPANPGMKPIFVVDSNGMRACR
jgi:hypothetical protein